MHESTADEASAALAELAEAHGVSTAYWSFYGEHVRVPASTLRAVLGAMGVAASTDAEIDTALRAAHDGPWRALLPPSLVVREGSGDVFVSVADGHDVSVEVELEDGTRRALGIPDQDAASRTLDDATVWRVRVPLPADLPLGWHRLHAVERGHDGAESRRDDCVLVVTPNRLPDPPSRPGNGGRAWGVMAQLYSVRSRGSWGIGDFADLGELAAVSGQRGADFLLVNPIHAAEVTSPIEPSPYLPATRRFVAALYLRPEDIPEAARLDADARARVERAHARVAASNADASHIDRDASWTAKREALEAVFLVPRDADRQRAFAEFAAREGQALADFALWCALQELDAAESAPEPSAERVEFYSWLQWVADEQLAAAQASATGAGMRIGIMHDLAVGVHPLGSDTWSRPDTFAAGASVGAPPDMYNQQGQNWSQPPWLPDALARSAYAPLRDLLRGLLRHAGALRIDHIMGLFRLWWIPDGLGASAGTYVRYDHEAMIGVLALEAHRAGAVVIGEDLGNVEPWVRDYLAARGILGTSVLWFEHADGAPLAPERYRQSVLATVNTHDLPPTAGYLAGEHVELRARLGVLEEPLVEARESARRERDTMVGLLRERGLVSPGAEPDEEEIVAGLHAWLAQSPARLLGVALVDAVGERRAQNQPGTHREYPNWQVPLADAEGRAVLLDDLARNPRFLALTAAVDASLRG
ncbi:MAG: 4-alpha-glucanotransferase [Microbacterium sp.]|uniref:4-alpha-glucanotransferase n=1 Tax=Microbacterium sp. TaxID=51671 RepID=UPI0039E3A656